MPETFRVLFLKRSSNSWSTDRVAAALLLAGLLATVPAFAQERRYLAQGRSGRPTTFIAAGGQHSLFVNLGKVQAWGENSAGQLGTGSTGAAQTQPVAVTTSTGLTGVVAVAAGAAHSVALDSLGQVWTWGDNAQGQLGDGTNTASSVPVQLSGLPGFSGRVVAITAGAQTTYALTVAGEVWAWGDNTRGQLGDGSLAAKNQPLHITGVVDVKQLSAGSEHMLALDARGRIWAWGRNDHGQLGDGSIMDRPAPVELFIADPSLAFIDIAAGATHSLCLDDKGNALSWGDDGNGQLGNGLTVGDQPSPAQVSKTNGLNRAIRVIAGGVHSMALTAGGTVYSWGQDSEGQLGLGAALPGPQVNDPALVTAISGLPGAMALAAGDLHSMALQSEGKLLVWGSNIQGQSGTGTGTPVAAPTALTGMQLSGMLATAAAWKQSYFLKADGTIWSWGDNGEGQLGDGTVTQRSTPKHVTGVDNIIAISANTSNILALRGDGTVWGWGKNHAGQVGLPPNTGQDCPPGNGDKVCRPIQIGAGTLPPVKAVAAGTYFNLVILADGGVWSWGANGSQQLGRGVAPDEWIPALIPGLPEQVISVAGGGDHGMALMSNGTLKTWGRNGLCEGGTANCCGHNGPGVTRCSNPVSQPDVGVPTLVAGPGGTGTLQRITAINAGLYHHSMALDVNGRVWTWGDNNDGQLGDGNFSGWVGSYPEPVLAPGGGPGLLEEIQAIAAGGRHTLGLRSDGTVYAWGADNPGQLGDGPPANVEVYPVTGNTMRHVIGLHSGAGLQHSVIRRDTWLKCATGLNDFGQLGDGTLTPVNAYFCDASMVSGSVNPGGTPPSTFTWDPVDGSDDYTVYRGLVPAGAPFAYNHTCQTPGGVSGCPTNPSPCPPQFEDAADPPAPGDIYYYLMSHRDGLIGEDHLGRSTSYELRPNLAPCP